MPTSDDDAAGAHGGGPWSYWLAYKITKFGPGWVACLALLAIGWVVGKLS